MNYLSRIKKIRNKLRNNDCFPYLVSSLINIKYCTGFDGSYGYLIFFLDETVFISDSRYEEYAISILPQNVRFVLQEKDVNQTLSALLKKKSVKKLFLEEHAISLSQYKAMKEHCRGIALEYGGDNINELRVIKEEEEIEIIKQAAKLTDLCFDHILKILKPGITEWDVATEIEYFYKKNGCLGTSFATIVASGNGSSMPHYKTDVKIIKEGDPVLIDMGCIYNGYCSDITRTVFVHNASEDIKNIYLIVKKAQENAIVAVKPGMTTNKLDSIARDFIAAHGYADMFGHSLGHGVGMDVHEIPAIKQNGMIKLKKGMVITIEPGIYLPKRGGVRIEDMVLITNNGYEVLTKSPKDIIVL